MSGPRRRGRLDRRYLGLPFLVPLPIPGNWLEAVPEVQSPGFSNGFSLIDLSVAELRPPPPLSTASSVRLSRIR
jgi:hypothetical protein